MIQVWKHFHSYDKSTLPSNFALNQRPSRKHDFQLRLIKPSDGIRGVQTNSFYFRTATKWNNLQKSIVDAKTMDTFKARLDEDWNDSQSKFTLEQHQRGS